MRTPLFVFFAVLGFLPPDVRSQGNPLGPEFRINTYTTNFQGVPSVAADPSGNLVVVWESQYDVGIDRLIVGQRYDSSGAPLGGEFPVSNSVPFGGSDNAAAVATDAAGNFVVVWHETPLDDANILGRRFASSGAPLGGQFEVGTSLYNFNPAVASDSPGNFVVVWQGSFPGDGSGPAVFGRRYASSGTLLGATFRVNTWTTNDQTYSSVAADPSGNFVVVWQSVGQDGSGLGVFGQRFAGSGVPLGSEFRVNTYTTSSQHRPSVAVDSSGNFVVAWQSMVQDGDGEGVFGQRFANSGAPLGPEFRINTYTTAGQSGPAVAADPTGNFVVTWQSPQDASNGVFGQRFADSGIALGPEFRINTYTAGSQVVASVAADSFGNFVVAWQSFNQDGSNYGVFGQRYRPILPVELMRFRVE
jgi:hypothetical protein